MVSNIHSPDGGHLVANFMGTLKEVWMETYPPRTLLNMKQNSASSCN